MLRVGFLWHNRKKKLFASYDLCDLLKKEGVGCSALDMHLWQSPFDLSIFDDFQFETRSPAEWLPPMNGYPSPPAKAARFGADGSCTWQDCLVHDFDGCTNQCQIQFLDEDTTCRLPRLFVCFQAEDPLVFCKRLSTAYKERKKAETLLR